MRTASRNAAARSVRAARSSAGIGFTSCMVPMEAIIVSDMKARSLLLVLLLLAACSKITQENFGKIEQGMPEQQVLAILGSPTESSSVDVLGVSGTSARWTSADAQITVRFVNGKVALKSF